MFFFLRYLFCNHLDGEERAGCFAQFVFLVSRDGCLALPRGATGLSPVCEIILTIFDLKETKVLTIFISNIETYIIS